MAKRDSAPRRYAEAAFQLATRDGSIEQWRRELEQAAALTDGQLMDALANPALPLDQRLAAADRVLADLSQSVRNLVCSSSGVTGSSSCPASSPSSSAWTSGARGSSTPPPRARPR